MILSFHDIVSLTCLPCMYSDRFVRANGDTCPQPCGTCRYLPFSEKVVSTPEGHQYVGVDFAKSLCGVSIIRSGEAMEAALRGCCSGIKIGKILVHRCVPN